MRLVAYTVFDTASGVYQRPFFMHADGEARRIFADLCADAEHPVGKHPEDYSLFRIGMYDDNKGVLSAETLECLCTGLEMVAQARNIAPGSLREMGANVNGG